MTHDSKDVIASGMYRGQNKPSPQKSIDPRRDIIHTEHGTVTVPSVQYVDGLEERLVSLEKTVATLGEHNRQMVADLRRWKAALAKIEKRMTYDQRNH